MDAASPQSAEVALPAPSAESTAHAAAAPQSSLQPTSDLAAQPIEPLDNAPLADAPFDDALLEQLWREADAEKVDLAKPDFAAALCRVGLKYNYGLPPAALPAASHKSAFYRGLQLQELALAQACALGRDAAWKEFLSRYRPALTQAAIAIAKSASLGQDLADSLYSELFGLTERDSRRQSPLLSYSGRGSLMGWLRATLAQRHVDHHRRTHRETPLEDDFAATSAAATTAATPSLETLARLDHSLSATLRLLSPDDRFLLSAYFLDRRTLLQIASLLQVHEATVSRKLKRLTASLRGKLLQHLQTSGLGRRAAEEALGTDPRDLSINLRNVLQTSLPSPFSEQQRPEPRITP